jgi:P27 family predicted phage terminase small subunit
VSGPPRKPVALQLIRGNPGKRKLPKEPQPASSPRCPEPPDYVTGAAADEWKRVGPQLHALGLLTLVDLSAFAVYCISFARWKLAEGLLEGQPLVVGGYNENPVVNPLVRVAGQAARDTVRFAAEFGMTPSSRAGVSAAGKPFPSKFGDLLA